MLLVCVIGFVAFLTSGILFIKSNNFFLFVCVCGGGGGGGGERTEYESNKFYIDIFVRITDLLVV